MIVFMYIRQREPAKIVSKEWKLTIVFLRGLNVVSPDGNGRTGRLAMNYFLVLHEHPPITIHEEDRKEYYEALETWDREQELQPMCQFLRGQTVKTWERQIVRMEKRKHMKQQEGIEK